MIDRVILLTYHAEARNYSVLTGGAELMGGGPRDRTFRATLLLSPHSYSPHFRKELRSEADTPYRHFLFSQVAWPAESGSSFRRRRTHRWRTVWEPSDNQLYHHDRSSISPSRNERPVIRKAIRRQASPHQKEYRLLLASPHCTFIDPEGQTRTLHITHHATVV